MERNKIIIIIFTAFAFINLNGCKSSSVDSNRFQSVIERNHTLKKVSKLAVKDYLKYKGCSSELLTNIVGAIPNTSSQKSSFTSEHWIVQGCNKNYNLKLDFGNNGKSVDVSEYEL